ncbi:MAK10-like protein [Tanacetum coccineum]
MGDENPICTLGDYSKPSHEGYRNTIELPVENNVVPLRSDTIRLVQTGCLFHGLRNWLERLPAGSITTWEDLTTRFLAQFFPPGRTAKLRNDILMFQQHHGESLSESWTRWDEINEFVKPVKAIAIPHGIPKTPDRRLLELEDQISFLLKGSRPTPTSSSAHAPQAFVKAAHPNSHPQNQNEPPTLNTFAFHEPTGPSPQPQALETTFEIQMRDYMAAHTEIMERFKNTIFKQREEINGRMTEMFKLIKELTTSRTLEKVLISEEAKFPVTKNGILSLWKKEKKRGVTRGRAGNESIKTPESEEVVEASGSQPVAYYLKHKINKKLIKGLVNNNRFNNSLSGARVGKKKKKAYNVLPGGPVYEATLKKKITKKEDIEGNFKIPCSIGCLKPAETDIRFSLASNSYIYPLGIAKDVLVEVAEHIYPADFVIMDIKENEKRPFILRITFLTTVKASIKFDTGTITLRLGKGKISFYRIPEPLFHVKKGIKNDIEPIAPTMTVNRLVLEWGERIRLPQEKEMEFNQ